MKLILLVLPLLSAADRSQDDCQENELYVSCGQCEATCWEQHIKCSTDCKPARCECLSSNGFLRTKHGHCIHVSECPGPNIYSMDSSRGGKMNEWSDGRKKRSINGPRYAPVFRPSRPYVSRGADEMIESSGKIVEFASGRPRQGFGSYRL